MRGEWVRPVLMWLVAVLACATLTWVVIDRAGRDVGAEATTTTSAPRPSGRTHSTRPGAPSASTFSTTGGTLTAACEGKDVRLRSATPADGYQLQQDRDRGVLTVWFHDVEGEDMGELALVCRAGVVMLALDP